nr:hypothetical protein [Tanacetum cinerariifolium]
MTRRSTKKLVKPFKEPEREFRSLGKLFRTRRLDYLSSPELNLFSDQEDQYEEEVAEEMEEPTMEEYITKTQEDYGSGIGRPKIDEKPHFELKGLDVSTRQILDSKGVIPSMNATEAKKSIQDIADYSQKGHNGMTTKTRSTDTSDGLAVIQAQLNNLGRETDS